MSTHDGEAELRSTSRVRPAKYIPPHISCRKTLFRHCRARPRLAVSDVVLAIPCPASDDEVVAAPLGGDSSDRASFLWALGGGRAAVSLGLLGATCPNTPAFTRLRCAKHTSSTVCASAIASAACKAALRVTDMFWSHAQTQYPHPIVAPWHRSSCSKSVGLACMQCGAPPRGATGFVSVEMFG